MNIGILGGGMMGLTLALRLGRAGHRVTVLEAAPQVGGLATWFLYGEFIWDKYYHVICRTDEELLGMMDELGMAQAVRWSNTRTGFIWQGRQISMSSNREFLTFPALSLIDKGRLALGILRCQRMNDPGDLEKISAPDWLRRIFGESVYRVIWEPLLESKYGALKEAMPATIIWATIRRYYSTRGKGGREQLGYISGGYKAFFEALLRAIWREGGEVLCRQRVLAVEETGGGVSVRTADRMYEFDRVIGTLPGDTLRKLTPAVSWDARARPRPRMLGVVCVSLVLRQPLNLFYITNLIQKGFPFTGIIGVSNLTGAAEFGGRHLAVLPRYEVPEAPCFERDPEELAGEFVEALRPIWPDIQQNVVRCFVNRERMVQSLWFDGSLPPEAPAKSVSGKIWSVNAELTGRDTLNNNAIIHAAKRAAEEFLESARVPLVAAVA